MRLLLQRIERLLFYFIVVFKKNFNNSVFSFIFNLLCNNVVYFLLFLCVFY